MKNLYKILATATAVLLLQSCLAVREYEAPKDQLLEENFRTDRLPQDTLSMADISWREIFTDSVLQNYIERALENNIDIRKALRQISIAGLYVQQGKAGYLPSLNAGADYTRSYPSDNGPQALSQGNHISLYNLSGNLSWEADIWGKITSQKNVFESAYLQSLAAHKLVKTELIAGIASAYYQLLAVDDQVRVTEKTIETRKNSLETTKVLKEAGTGTVTSTAVQQTEAQYLEAQSILIGLKTQARMLENAISILMGEEPHALERSELSRQQIETLYTTGVPSRLLSNRPDVLVAEAAYRQAFEMTNVASASRYPSFTIGLSGGLQSLSLDNWFETNSLFGSMVGGITAPVFNGKALKTQYEVSKLRQQQALLDYKQVLLTASKEVSDALYNYQAATDKIDIKQTQRDLLEQAVEDSQALLEAGYNNFSYLEVLTAQESVLNASLSLINERVAQLNSMVELYRALGGGWK